jgi:drug/metabolite transporter (DMT)-like permease
MPILVALAAAGVYGASDFLGGFASKRNAAGTVVLLSQLCGAALLVVCYALQPLPITRADVLFGALGGVAGAIAIVMLYAALSVGRMGVISPVNAVVSASVPVLFGIGFGERPTVFAIVGVCCALGAVILVSLDATTRSISLREPGLALALGSGVAIGVLYVALGGAHGGSGFGRLVVTRCVSLAVLCCYVFARRFPLRAARGTLRYIAPAGVLDMGANILYVIAAHGGLISLVAVVTSLYPVSTVLLARFFLAERLSPIQWAGVACAIGGVVLVAL